MGSFFITLTPEKLRSEKKLKIYDRIRKNNNNTISEVLKQIGQVDARRLRYTHVLPGYYHRCTTKLSHIFWLFQYNVYFFI